MSNRSETPSEPLVLGLQVLAHVAASDDLLQRFLNLSGLTPGTLRDRAGDPAFLAGLIDFLAANESDLVAAADAIGTRPERIVAAGRQLETMD